MSSRTTNRFAPEVRSRAVRMVFEHESDHASRWAAIASIAAKIGCTPETLRLWVKRAEREGGKIDGAAPDLNARLKARERENRELRQANEILRWDFKALFVVDRSGRPSRTRQRHARMTSSIDSSGRRDPTGSGSPISPMWRPGWVSSTSPS